jgi:hypothetical protein
MVILISTRHPWPHWEPKHWYATIQDHKHPGHHMQPIVSTLDPPSTTTDASDSTFLLCATSASLAPGLYPAHCQVPVALQHDLSIAAAADLLRVFGGTVLTSMAEKIKHIQAIQELTTIMAGQQTTPPTVDAPNPSVVAPCPKVMTNLSLRVATTSNNITTPYPIRQMPLVHQRHTRNNNTFNILSGNDDDDDTVVANNYSPRAPPTIIPPSIPPVNPPMRQAPR